VGDANGTLVRLTASADVPWTTSEALVGAPAVGLALAGDSPSILVPTDQGRLYAVGQADGLIQWSTALSAQALQPANVWTEDGASTGTAYLAGDAGVLYAVVVDGPLDTGAPWPKAYHDAQNTSWAGAAP
jgi:outer membrane protein assembly factor BamB